MRANVRCTVRTYAAPYERTYERTYERMYASPYERTYAALYERTYEQTYAAPYKQTYAAPNEQTLHRTNGYRPQTGRGSAQNLYCKITISPGSACTDLPGMHRTIFVMLLIVPIRHCKQSNIRQGISNMSPSVRPQDPADRTANAADVTSGSIDQLFVEGQPAH